MSDSLADQAAKIGAEHGRNAASWVFDGNTPAETYATVLRGLEDGDPAIYDMFREPSLSGEFADDYTSSDLMYDLGISDESTHYQDELCDAWQESASESFWSEVERIAREHVQSERIKTLRSAGFHIMYTFRPTEDRDYISWSDLSNYPADEREPYADLSSIGKGEDTAGQSTTLDRSNYRRLREDYPDTFTPVSYSNVDSLGAFVADLSDDVIETLTDLREQYPVYDEEDMSAIESEEIDSDWDDFAADDLGRELPEVVQDAWESLSGDEKRELFAEACETAGYWPEHNGIEVLWSYAYERTAEYIAGRLSA